MIDLQEQVTKRLTLATVNNPSVLHKKKAPSPLFIWSFEEVIQISKDNIGAPVFFYVVIG